MTRVLVVGAGTGGVPAAYELRGALGAEHERFGQTDPVYERYVLKALGIERLER